MKSTNSQFIFLFIFFIIVYSLGSFSKIPFGDCVGYVLTTEKGIFIKEATATSHILYINATILIKKLLHGYFSTFHYDFDVLKNHYYKKTRRLF